MLTENDLINMRFSIGAKNKIIQFQKYFKHKSKRDIKNMTFCKNIIEIILEKNLGYTLKNFLIIARSSKDALLKAMHEMSQNRYEDETTGSKTLESLETMQNDDQTKISYEYHKEATPVKFRNSSIGSNGGSSYQEIRSSTNSAQIFTNNKGRYYDNSEKENINRQNYPQQSKNCNKYVLDNYSSLLSTMNKPVKASKAINLDINRLVPSYYDSEASIPNMIYQRYPQMKEHLNSIQQEVVPSINKMLKNRRRYMTGSNHGKYLNPSLKDIEHRYQHSKTKEISNPLVKQHKRSKREACRMSK
jgi:hypothetical protein